MEEDQGRFEGTKSPRLKKLAAAEALLPFVDPFERVRTTPKESIVQRASSPRRTATPTLKSAETSLEPLPRIIDTNVGLREKLLESKLNQCCYTCVFESVVAEENFYSSTEALSSADGFNQSKSHDSINLSPNELRNREIKRQTLIELIELISGVSGLAMPGKAIPDSLYGLFFKMIFVNIFRPVPPRLNPSGEAFDPTEDEPVLESSWPHLQLVYELFIRFLEAPEFNVSVAKRWIDSQFVLQLLALFDVEDPRERDLLKTTLHRIYAKFLQLRAFIRKAIQNVFYEFVSDPTDYRHNISEMLEILGSIINGFALPLKEEHKLFLERTLIPLHKTRYLALYYRQLCYCVLQFVEKEPSLIVSVVVGLLKIWPKTNSTKEVMFLSEIEELLDITPGDQFGDICIPLANQLAHCVDSNHFQVAERALLYWHNEYILNLMSGRCPEMLPLLLPTLSRHSKGHWNRNVQVLVLNALECFMEMDGVFFDACVARLGPERQYSNQQRWQKLQLWRKIDELADVARVNAHASEDEQARRDLYAILSSDLDSSELKPQKPQESGSQSPRLKPSSALHPPPTAAPLLSPTRRKSILPIDSEVFQKLQDYSSASTDDMDIEMKE